jgi:perosamine synthetase
MENIKNDIQELFTDTSFQTCHLTGNGVIREVEEMIRDYYEKKYVLTFPNATTAIWALILALNLQNKVIASSPFGWAGAIAPFLLFNNKVLFAGVDNSLNINGYETKWKQENIDAIFSMDYGGIPAETKRLKRIAQDAGAMLISDSSQSFGATRDGKPAGFWADAIILSFTSSKAINSLEGGAIVTDDKNIFQKLLRISQHPYRQKINLGIKSFNEFTPVNGRMNPFSALILKNTFSDQFLSLATIQDKYFTLYQQLIHDRVIMKIPGLESPGSSTFFEFLVEPLHWEKHLIGQLNKVHTDFNFQIVQLIPFWLRNGFSTYFNHSQVEFDKNTDVLNRIKITLKT